MSYIKTINLKKKIDNDILLKNINVNIEKGKVYGFWGKNGSGKTLLFKTICGLVKPTEGKIYIKNKELGKDIEFPDSCGILIDGPGYWPNRTAFDNLKLLLEMNKNNLSDNEINSLFKEIGFDEYKNKKIKEFSLGFRQRFGICQAIVGNPELIILDEPFNAIDEESISEISNILISQRNNGATILISSHDKDELRSICDYVYMLKNGEVIDLLKIDEF